MELNKKEQLALQQFQAALEKEFKDDLIEVKLFGSRARGDARRDSDIDVLIIVASDDWRVCDIVYDIATDILLEMDVCISPKVMSQKRYKYLYDAQTPFIKNVIRDGISVWKLNSTNKN